MLDEIKKILRSHLGRNPGAKIIKVTTTRYYEIPAGSSEDSKDLMEEWFKKYHPHRSHAFRDQSLLIEHFNEDAELITPDEQGKSFEDLDKEERYLFEAIFSARKVQEFLWGELNNKWDIEEWKRMFKKRIVKIDDISTDNPHAVIELKKRILQNAALCIALLKLLGDPRGQETLKRDDYPAPSNLPRYSTDN